jgi:hypothetical protein
MIYMNTSGVFTRPALALSARAAWAGIAVSLLACVAISTGRVEPTVTQGLVLGRTTEAEAIALLGRPEKLDRRQVDSHRVVISYLKSGSSFHVFGVRIEPTSASLEFVDGRLNGYAFDALDQPAPDESAIREALVFGARSRGA